MLMKAHQDASYIFSALATVLAVFVTQGLIFVPKIRAVFHDTAMLPTVIEEKAPSSIKHHIPASHTNSSNQLQVTPRGSSSTRRRQITVNTNRANDMERYKELNAENERVKEEIAQVHKLHCLESHF